MRPVRIPWTAEREIRLHAQEAYPDECCGFLIAGADPVNPDAPREVLSVRRAPNGVEAERGRRFVIPPEELRLLERSLEGTPNGVVGFYHSHPDHPARPSQFDQDHAWPWYTYLVLAVTAQNARGLGAFELDPDTGGFQEVPLHTEAPDGVRVAESLSAGGGT
jgi:proteasome lid subunit RPN8/RPN11